MRKGERERERGREREEGGRERERGGRKGERGELKSGRPNVRQRGSRQVITLCNHNHTSVPISSILQGYKVEQGRERARRKREVRNAKI